MRTSFAQQNALVFRSGMTDFDVLLRRNDGTFMILDFKFEGRSGIESQGAVSILQSLARDQGHTVLKTFAYSGSDGPRDKVANTANLRIRPLEVGGKTMTWAEFEGWLNRESSSPLFNHPLDSQLGKVPMKSATGSDLLFRVARDGSYTFILATNTDMPDQGSNLPVLTEFVNGFRNARFFRVYYNNSTASADATGRIVVEPLNNAARMVYSGRETIPKTAFDAYLGRDFARGSGRNIGGSGQWLTNRQTGNAFPVRQ